MQDGARAHTAGDTIELLERQDQLRPLLPHQWTANSPDLNPVDFCIWGELERRVFKGRLITTIEELKTAIRVEWKAFPQQTIDNAINSFKPRLMKVVTAKGGHIETY